MEFSMRCKTASKTAWS